ncbi:DUF2637 domain-containing protein [Nonomuraea sp. NPDC049152]|uniref:DUF2637 domain-containing protein n=1 Tax=Nonomuraea sp. NPDC049152 TaxID=3154350 RepID=UPI0033EC703E
MDVTPPSALRRIGIALAGLAVAGLTAAACVLSFDDLRALAVAGTARADLAYLYPAAFDALLAVALISVLLLRSGRLLVRSQAAVVLVLLITAAAAVNVLVTTDGAARLPAVAVAVGVAVAPWVMLAVALWLWLVMIKHVHARREPADAAERTAERDIVPFRGPSEAPPLAGTAEQEPEEPTPVVGPTPAPETPPVPPIPVSEERVAPWQPEQGRTTEPQAVPKPRTDPDPDLDPAPMVETHAPEASRHDPERSRQNQEPSRHDTEPGRHDTAPAEEELPGPLPVEGAKAAHTDSEALTTEELPRAAEEHDQEADAVTAPHPVHSGEPAEPTKPAEPVDEPERPVRWGDLSRAEPTDVLVHPRPDSVRDADTQPVRVVSGRPIRPLAARADAPDPGHGPEAADETEPVLGPGEPPEEPPHPDAPSGRLRSTPLPPEE